MKKQIINILENNQQELGEDIGVGASMYGVTADQIMELISKNDLNLFMQLPVGSAKYYEVKDVSKFTKNATAHAHNYSRKINQKTILGYVALTHKPVTLVRVEII